MWRVILIAGCTIAVAAIGFYLGCSIHGLNFRALLAGISGAAGGFGIGVIGYDVWRQQQFRRQAQDSSAPQRLR